MDEGWIAVWRTLRHHQFWQQRRRFSKAEAWLDILMDASFVDHDMVIGNTIVPIKRGQAPISQREKAKVWGWARESVRQFMTLLVNLEMVVHEVVHGPDGGRTILTIRNYECHQSSLEYRYNHKPGHELGRDLGRVPAAIQAIHNKGNKEREVVRARKTSPAAKTSNGKVPPGYQEAVDFWFREFERTKGAKPQFDKTEGVCLKRLLAAHSLPQVKALITHMLTRTQLRHIRERHAYSLHSLLGSWNELWAEYRARAVAEGEDVPA